MSYAGGMGIAIPSGITARRGVAARHGVTARGWGRGIGSYSGSLGATSPASTPADMTFSLAEVDAENAVRAVIAASAAARRSPIAAVRTFQQSYGHGLTVDGIYGANTRAALIAVTGRTDLPAVGSSGSSSSSASTTVAPVVDPLAPDASLAVGDGLPAWLVPVAIVGTLTVVGGVILMRRPKVKANRRRRRK